MLFIYGGWGGEGGSENSQKGYYIIYGWAHMVVYMMHTLKGNLSFSIFFIIIV